LRKKLYKFKSFPINPQDNNFKSTSEWKFIEDIFENNRLYCSHFKQLNDAMEGVYWFRELPQDKINKIRSDKDCFKICSLSTKINSDLMWAYYANSENGIAIEVVIEPSLCYKVIYSKDRPIFNETCMTNILITKTKEWKHESEYRILKLDSFHNDTFVDIMISKIFFGKRVDNKIKLEIIAKCNEKNIEYEERKEIL
jgi:hypothetical protein